MEHCSSGANWRICESNGKRVRELCEPQTLTGATFLSLSFLICEAELLSACKERMRIECLAQSTETECQFSHSMSCIAKEREAKTELTLEREHDSWI